MEKWGAQSSRITPRHCLEDQSVGLGARTRFDPLLRALRFDPSRHSPYLLNSPLNIWAVVNISAPRNNRIGYPDSGFGRPSFLLVGWSTSAPAPASASASSASPVGLKRELELELGFPSRSKTERPRFLLGEVLLLEEEDPVDWEMDCEYLSTSLNSWFLGVEIW